MFVKFEAVVLQSTKRLVMEPRTISTRNDVPPGHVVVQIGCLGICGSDVEYWRHGRIGNFIVQKPMIIGHEGAGTISHVGPGVTSLSVGDRVALEPGIPCRHCRLCLAGRYNLCPSIRFFATPPVDGCLCGFVVHPADFCFKLPPNVTLEEGALCEPLSVGVHACRRAKVAPGSNVMVFGAGPIGIVAMLTAKAFGAKWVGITDIVQSRLEMAKSMGADFTLNVLHCDAWSVAGAVILAAPDSGHVDASIECSGMHSATVSAIRVTSPGGVVCCIGIRTRKMKLPLMDAIVKEVDIRGIFRYRNSYAACIGLIQSKKVDVTPLITHRFEFKDFQEAFETAANAESGAMKVIIRVSHHQTAKL